MNRWFVILALVVTPTSLYTQPLSSFQSINQITTQLSGGDTQTLATKNFLTSFQSLGGTITQLSSSFTNLNGLITQAGGTSQLSGITSVLNSVLAGGGNSLSLLSGTNLNTLVGQLGSFSDLSSLSSLFSQLTDMGATFNQIISQFGSWQNLLGSLQNQNLQNILTNLDGLQWLQGFNYSQLLNQYGSLGNVFTALGGSSSGLLGQNAFGGPVTVTPCENGVLMITVGPPHGGTFIFQTGVSLLFQFNQLISGQSVLGNASTVPGVCTIGSTTVTWPQVSVIGTTGGTLPSQTTASSTPTNAVCGFSSIPAVGYHTYSARGTGYYPSSSALEGGFTDRKGQPLYTLQQYLAGGAPYVTVAMDTSAFTYGTKLRIPQLEQRYGKCIEFQVRDTGGRFRGTGTGRIDIATANNAASLDSTINGPLTLIPLISSDFPLVHSLGTGSGTTAGTGGTTGGTVASTGSTPPAGGGTPQNTIGQPAGFAYTGAGDEQTVRSKLSAIGVTVNNPPCSKTQTRNCTNVIGLPQAAIDGLQALVGRCGALTLTGGTEPGHRTHGPGRAVVDLRRDASLTSCIKAAGGQAKTLSWGIQYVMNGDRLVDEFGVPHWHVIFPQPY